MNDETSKPSPASAGSAAFLAGGGEMGARQQPWGGGMFLVAVTGWGQDEDRRRTAEAGFDGHLVTPVEHLALVKLLAEMRP